MLLLVLWFTFVAQIRTLRISMMFRYTLNGWLLFTIAVCSQVQTCTSSQRSDATHFYRLNMPIHGTSCMRHHSTKYHINNQGLCNIDQDFELTTETRTLFVPICSCCCCCCCTQLPNALITQFLVRFFFRSNRSNTFFLLNLTKAEQCLFDCFMEIDCKYWRFLFAIFLCNDGTHHLDCFEINPF